MQVHESTLLMLSQDSGYDLFACYFATDLRVLELGLVFSRLRVLTHESTLVTIGPSGLRKYIPQDRWKLPSIKEPISKCITLQTPKKKKEKEKLQHIKQCKEEGEMNMIERRNRRN